jgi:hypothetical protein
VIQGRGGRGIVLVLIVAVIAVAFVTSILPAIVQGADVRGLANLQSLFSVLLAGIVGVNYGGQHGDGHH